ncbi:MAG: hypothetical protein IPL56_15635 [Saprospiraceae bacterium]|nr:hypothetical protein [Saprospiraceae bacterium]
MKNYFEKYFDIITLNINKNFENPNITDIEKNKLSIYLEIIEDLKKNMLWQATSIHEKQSNRIMWLASMRKSEAPVSVIEKQKKTINVYERINNTLPFCSR